MRLERFAPIWLCAIGLAAVTALRAVLVLAIAVLHGDWSEFGRACLAVLVAGLGGAAGGLVYVFVGVPLRSLPWIGRYVAGIITVAAYLGSVLVMIEYVAPGEGLSIHDPASRYAFVICAVLFGIAIGQFWFGDAGVRSSD